MKRKISTTNHAGSLTFCAVLFTLFLISPFISAAQNVAINSDGSKADPNAILDIKSTTKGLLIPRMTTAQRMKVPQTNGLMIYDVTTKTFWYSDGESWKNMAADLSVVSTDAWLLTGNAGTSESINFIGTTDDRSLNFRVNNQKSGRIDNTYGNTFFGFRSGFNNMPGIGQSNTAIGSSALFSSVDGGSNTAVGADAMRSTTSGFDNSAFGRMALLNNTTGHDNTAAGLSAMFSNTTGHTNTVIGVQALYNNTAGESNTVVGALASFGTVSGLRNTVVGTNAMKTIGVPIE